MRYVLAVLCLIHGIAHIVGFVVPWRLVNSLEQPYRTTVLQGRVDLGEWGIRLYGLIWLLLAVCFAAMAVAVCLRSSWWLAGLEILFVISMLFCLLSWPDTRFGILANLIVLGLAFALLRFEPGRLAMRNDSLETLWSSVKSGDRTGWVKGASSLPPTARLYLDHALGSSTRPISSVRLTMHGEIKLGSWRPFHAEQVITGDGRFVWAAIVSLYGLPIRGSDQLLNGEGSMTWKFLDIIPVMTTSGPDITRSAIGRWQGELVAWLPSLLLNDFSWSDDNSAHTRVRMEMLGERSEVTIELDASRSLKTLSMPRWGNPDGGEFKVVDFGVIVEENRRFEGFTVPGKIRAGWFFGTERFESEGEFFRGSIDSAEFK